MRHLLGNHCVALQRPTAPPGGRTWSAARMRRASLLAITTVGPAPPAARPAPPLLLCSPLPPPPPPLDLCTAGSGRSSGPSSASRSTWAAVARSNEASGASSSTSAWRRDQSGRTGQLPLMHCAATAPPARGLQEQGKGPCRIGARPYLWIGLRRPGRGRVARPGRRRTARGAGAPGAEERRACDGRERGLEHDCGSGERYGRSAGRAAGKARGAGESRMAGRHSRQRLGTLGSRGRERLTAARGDPARPSRRAPSSPGGRRAAW
jgi:hypothetical protein